MQQDRHRSYLQRAQEIGKAIPPEDRPYYAEQLVRSYLLELEPDMRENILVLASVLFTEYGNQLINDALRDNAIRPEHVVERDKSGALPARHCANCLM